MKAILISVGDELVSGQTVDTNSAHLASELSRLGIETIEHQTVADDRPLIARAIQRAAQAAELVLVSGGLGPTADDLTRQALADAMGVELVPDEQCLADIEAFFRQRGRQMTASNRLQAMVPRGARPLANRVGTAPGIWATVGAAEVFVMPGVPSEMKWMFEHHVAPRLKVGGRVILHHVIRTFGAGESDVGSAIADLMQARTGPLLVGTTVAAGMVSVRITSRGEAEQARRQIERTAEEVRRRLGNLVIGEGEATLPSAVGELLRRREQTLATAESCTGGLLGEMITSAAGASDYYLGGVVAYANRVKEALLDVSATLLASAGAVSEPVAAAMAEGCLRRFACDWALSVTGIAGPAGGTAEKPVGLVYIGLAGPEVRAVHRHVFPGDRQTVRLRSALAAMNYLRLALLNGEP